MLADLEAGDFDDDDRICRDAIDKRVTVYPIRFWYPNPPYNQKDRRRGLTSHKTFEEAFVQFLADLEAGDFDEEVDADATSSASSSSKGPVIREFSC